MAALDLDRGTRVGPQRAAPTMDLLFAFAAFALVTSLLLRARDPDGGRPLRRPDQAPTVEPEDPRTVARPFRRRR